MRAIHYAGPLQWTNANGTRVTVLAGFAACCSGAKAQKIRAAEANTFHVVNVTCVACLKNIDKARVSRRVASRTKWEGVVEKTEGPFIDDLGVAPRVDARPGTAAIDYMAWLSARVGKRVRVTLEEFE